MKPSYNALHNKDMKIAIFGRTFQAEFAPYIRDFFLSLNNHNTDLYIYERFAEFLKDSVKIDPGRHTCFSDQNSLPSDTCFLFSLGGDGTFLETVNIVGDSGIPVLGINTGRLGFLASISLENLKESVSSLFDGQYYIEERTMIQMHIFGEENTVKPYMALNDVTVHKKDTGMITVRVELNNEYLNSYWADGLIIATPTGSTAYSMSVGGPIILPETNNFIISPVSPHNLSMRPIVIPDSKTIKLIIDSRSDEFLVSIDSRSIKVSLKNYLIIDKAPFKMKLVRIHGSCFYNTLRNKLMWGLDKRN